MENEKYYTVKIYNKKILKQSLILTASSALVVGGVANIVVNAVEGNLDMMLLTLSAATALVSFGVAYDSGRLVKMYTKQRKECKKNRGLYGKKV